MGCLQSLRLELDLAIPGENQIVYPKVHKSQAGKCFCSFYTVWCTGERHEAREHKGEKMSEGEKPTMQHNVLAAQMSCGLAVLPHVGHTHTKVGTKLV